MTGWSLLYILVPTPDHREQDIQTIATSYIATDSRALDELDVYLDEINRSEVEEMLLEFAKENPVYQFIFISPQPPSGGGGVNVIEIEKK